MTRRGVKLRSTVEREKLYGIAMALRAEGLSYNAIIATVRKDHGVSLSKSNISGWVNGKHQPFGSVRAFDAKPCPELAYVIGVKWGDASTSVNRNHNHMIKLRVIDREFAEEFARCLSMVLGRSKPSVRWHQKTSSWHTEVSSVLLQTFLRREPHELKDVVEHCRNCAGAFLRGFFDSEGWVYGRDLV